MLEAHRDLVALLAKPLGDGVQQVGGGQIAHRRPVRTLMEDRLLPDFGLEIGKVSYADGCKVYFQGQAPAGGGDHLYQQGGGVNPVLPLDVSPVNTGFKSDAPPSPAGDFIVNPTRRRPR